MGTEDLGRSGVEIGIADGDVDASYVGGGDIGARGHGTIWTGELRGEGALGGVFAPRLSFGSLSTREPALGRVVLRQVLTEHRDELLHCFESTRAPHDPRTVIATVRFVVQGDGSIAPTNISVEGAPPALATCLNASVRGLAFPRPADHVPVPVSTTLVATLPE